MKGPRTFGQCFRVHHAVHEIVTGAASSGSPICVRSIVSALMPSFSAFTPSELERIVRATALEHDVPLDAGGREAAGRGSLASRPAT